MNSLVPACAGRLTAYYQATALLSRIRNSDFRQILKAAAPKYIDNVLYIGEESAMECSHRVPFGVSIKSFSAKIYQGWIELTNGLHRIGRSTLFFVVVKLLTKPG